MKINFNSWYSKLDKDSFTTIRWIDKFYKVGRVYDIYWRTGYASMPMFLCKAKIVKIELKKINQLTPAFIKQDADCDIDKFFNMMKRWYKEKPDWKDILSEVQVIYLEKQEG